MTPKEYLNQIRRLNEKINHNLSELDELKSLITSISGIDYGKEKLQGSPKDFAPLFVKLIEKISVLNEKINAQIDEYIDTKTHIIAQIEGMEDSTYSELLYKRYVEFKRLELIACEMSYSYERIRHLHGLSLQEFGEKYGIK